MQSRRVAGKADSGILKRLTGLMYEASTSDIEAIVDNVLVSVEKSVLLLEGVSLGNENAQEMIVDRGEDRFPGRLHSDAAPTALTVPETIGALLKQRDRAIFIAIEVAKGHFRESPAGSVLLSEKGHAGATHWPVQRIACCQSIHDERTHRIGQMRSLMRRRDWRNCIAGMPPLKEPEGESEAFWGVSPVLPPLP